MKFSLFSVLGLAIGTSAFVSNPTQKLVSTTTTSTSTTTTSITTASITSSTPSSTVATAGAIGSSTQLFGKRKPFITGNWKLNPATKAEAISLAQDIAASVQADSPGDVGLFVPFPFIETVMKICGDKVTVGAEVSFVYCRRRCILSFRDTQSGKENLSHLYFEYTLIFLHE
jgi:Triosephosphate isomerase